MDPCSCAPPPTPTDNDDHHRGTEGKQLELDLQNQDDMDNMVSAYVLEIDWSQIPISQGETAVLEFQFDPDNGGGQYPVSWQLHNESIPVPVVPVIPCTIPSNSSNEALCLSLNQSNRNVIPNLALGLVQSQPAGEEPVEPAISAIFNSNSTKTNSKPKVKKETKDEDETKLKKGRPAPASRSPASCPQCSKVFSSPHSLKRHIVTHSADPSPFKCEDCGKCFTQSAGLLVHKREIHSGDKVTHVCAFCPKTFRRNRVLKAHILKVHSTIEQKGIQTVALKPHQNEHECEMCGSKFRYRQDLTRHRSKHSGEKRHQCPHCPRSFRLGYNLQEHIEGHLGKKKFQSKYCGRTFRQKYLLLNHEKRHEQEGICKYQPFKIARCQECPETFPTSFLCNQHKIIKHSVETSDLNKSL